MEEFIVFFEHNEYGFYTLEIDADSILEALELFVKKYAYKEVYGIMQKK